MSKFEIYKGKDADPEECWRWRLIEGNSEPIAKSEEAFYKNNTRRSIKTIKEHVTPVTPICEEDGPDEDKKAYRFVYFQSDKDEKWYWRLTASNGELMAIGGEGFESEYNVKRSIENVRLEMGRAEIEFENPEDDPAYDAKEDNKMAGTTKKRGVPGSWKI